MGEAAHPSLLSEREPVLPTLWDSIGRAESLQKEMLQVTEVAHSYQVCWGCLSENSCPVTNQSICCGNQKPHIRNTHLNEEAGEFGRQVSCIGLYVVFHEEAHPSDATHSNWDLQCQEESKNVNGGVVCNRLS